MRRVFRHVITGLVSILLDAIILRSRLQAGRGREGGRREGGGGRGGGGSGRWAQRSARPAARLLAATPADRSLARGRRQGESGETRPRPRGCPWGRKCLPAPLPCGGWGARCRTWGSRAPPGHLSPWQLLGWGLVGRDLWVLPHRSRSWSWDAAGARSLTSASPQPQIWTLSENSPGHWTQA